MRLPSKVTSYKESSIPKMVYVLGFLKKEDYKPIELYKKVKRRMENVGEFVEILDDLYILGRVEMISKEGVLRYVESSKL